MLSRAYEVQRENTQEEIRHLSKSYHEYVDLFKIRSKPNVFIACSEKADEDVMGCITEELDKYQEKGLLNYTDWREMEKTGVVISEIGKSIQSSLFGVCYFSQPAKDGGYIDNPNVLFESGLISAISGVNDFGSLIAIREKESEQAPFDIAGLKLIIVPRNKKDGKLNKDKFKNVDQLSTPKHSEIDGAGKNVRPKCLDFSILDEVVKVSDDDAISMCKSFANQTGILIGGSSGLNLCAAIDISKTCAPGSVILTLICDCGIKYLSTIFSPRVTKSMLNSGTI